MIFFECCCQGLDEALEAKAGGASRVELCSDLEVGGLTPAIGVLKETVAGSGLPVNVLVRPRAGDFVYNDDEARVIVDQIRAAKSLGANAIVVGALTRDGDVDMPRMSRFIQAAKPLEVTFHRAFDECREPREALEDIITLGCSRLLTSGLSPSAEKGISLIRELYLQARNRIIVMPGAGIRPENIKRIVNQTGCSEFHGSAHGAWGKTSRDVVRAIVEI